MINIAHKLDNKFAARNDCGYCGRDNLGNEIYVFKIYDIKIQESYYSNESKFSIFIRGVYTYWMDIDSCFISDEEIDLLEWIELEKRKTLLETKTYIVSTTDNR